MSVPGIGPVTASALASSVQNISAFSGPREFEAFLGPRHTETAFVGGRQGRPLSYAQALWAEEKIRIVLEGLRDEEAIAEDADGIKFGIQTCDTAVAIPTAQFRRSAALA